MVKLILIKPLDFLDNNVSRSYYSSNLIEHPGIFNIKTIKFK